jgi:hypothetical protein
VAKTLLPDEERAIYVHRKAVGEDEKAATPADNKDLRPIQMSGGGGNRTRVRRSLAEGFYMRSRCLKVRSALPPSAGAWGRASPAWISLPIPPGGEWLTSPLIDALSHPVGENWKDVAGCLAASASSSLAVVVSHLFYEPMGPRHPYQSISPVHEPFPTHLVHSQSTVLDFVDSTRRSAVHDNPCAFHFVPALTAYKLFTPNQMNNTCLR